MRTRNLVLFAALCMLTALSPVLAVAMIDSGPLPPTSTAQALKTAEVMGQSGTGIGSCYPVAEQGGYVAWLTCKHVAECEPTSVLMRNGNRWPIINAMLNPLADTALLWTRSNPAAPANPIPLGDVPAIGARAMLAGFPVDLGFWLSEGLIGSTDGNGATWCSVPIYYGCSGGPVLVNGRAVGVAMGIYIDRQRGVHNGPELRGMPVSTISALILVDQFRDWLADCLARDPSVK